MRTSIMAVNPVSTIVAVGKIAWEGLKLAFNAVKTGAVAISKSLEASNAKLDSIRTNIKLERDEEKAKNNQESLAIKEKQKNAKRKAKLAEEKNNILKENGKKLRARDIQAEQAVGNYDLQTQSNQTYFDTQTKINGLRKTDAGNFNTYQMKRKTDENEITQNLQKGWEHQQAADQAQKQGVDIQKESALSFKNTIQHYHQIMNEVRQLKQQGRQFEANECVAATLHQVAIDLIDYTAHNQQALAENKGEIGKAIADHTSSLELQHLLQLKDYVQQEIQAAVNARTATGFHHHQAARENQAQIAHHQQNLGNMHQVAAIRHETSFAQAKQQSTSMESKHQQRLEAIQSGLEGAISQKVNHQRIEDKGSHASLAMLSAVSANHGRTDNNDVQQQSQQTSSMAIVPK